MKNYHKFRTQKILIDFDAEIKHFFKLSDNEGLIPYFVV